MGEVKILGCNEVLSVRGGIYWEGDVGDSWEFYSGMDINEDFKYCFLNDILKNFIEVGLIDGKYFLIKFCDIIKFVKNDKGINLEKSLMMMDIIEYGRIIYVEMNVIIDVVRKGISIDNSILYCIIFFCYFCVKYIILLGINRVIYIELYFKSYVLEFYRDDIVFKCLDKLIDGKVYFELFIGVLFYRYWDFFEKGKRKDLSGKVKEW